MQGSKTIEFIPFGRRNIGPGLPVVVIAEIGINHEGDPEACMNLVEAAARAGADAVKFQVVKAAENYAPGTESYDLFRKSALTDFDTICAFRLARELGLECFATCSDESSIELVESLEPAAWKISSGLLTHLPLIRRLAATGRTLLLSTGMTGMGEVHRALASARDAGAKSLGLFQCTSLYPAPPETLNLRVIETLGREFNIPVGFSDHSTGTLAATISVACGAQMIEKHISLNPLRSGFDHHVSISPDEFKSMVDAIRLAEIMLGTREKTVLPVVTLSAEKFLRCVAARVFIPAGKEIESCDIAVLRLPTGERGLPPEAIDTVTGRCAVRDIAAFEPITLKDFS